MVLVETVAIVGVDTTGCVDDTNAGEKVNTFVFVCTLAGVVVSICKGQELENACG
jgi:hypothetical protein